jgi:hypothetical protein
LLYLPLFLIHLWRYHSWQKFQRSLLLVLLALALVLIFEKSLPYDQALYAQVKALPSLTINSDSSHWLAPVTKFLQEPFSMATSVGGKSTPSKILVFTFLYALINLFYFVLQKSKTAQGALLNLSSILYLSLALYFLVNDFSPHYYVWLSLFATLSLPLGFAFFLAYALSILGWGIMGLVATGNFAITQNLFLPVSPLIFNTPPLAFVLPNAPLISQLGHLLFSAGLLWSIYLVLRHLVPQMIKPRHWLKLFQAGALGVLFFLLSSNPAQAAKIPVLSLENDSKILLEVGSVYRASFIAPTTEFGALDLKFDTSRSQQNKRIALRLKRKDDSTWLYENTYQAKDFYNRAFYPFGFPTVTDALNQEFIYEVELLDASDLPLYIYANTLVVSREGSLTEIGSLIWLDLQAKWQTQRPFWLFWFTLLGLNFLAILMVLFWPKKKLV